MPNNAQNEDSCVNSNVIQILDIYIYGHIYNIYGHIYNTGHIYKEKLLCIPFSDFFFPKENVPTLSGTLLQFKYINTDT